VTKLEEAVLRAVCKLGPDSYGMTIRREVAAATRRDVSIGSIYVVLERLVAKGLLTERVGEPTSERGGRPKKYFRIAAAVCFECGCEMVPKPPHDADGNSFWECPNCGHDTEKDFDDAVRRGFELGLDVITEKEKGMSS